MFRRALAQCNSHGQPVIYTSTFYVDVSRYAGAFASSSLARINYRGVLRLASLSVTAKAVGRHVCELGSLSAQAGLLRQGNTDLLASSRPAAEKCKQGAKQIMTVYFRTIPTMN